MSSDSDGLDVALKTSRPDDEGRIVAVGYRVLGELASAHMGILWRLSPDGAQVYREHPHEHVSVVPCLSCAVSGASPVTGKLLSDMYAHRHLDEEWNQEVTLPETVASRVGRVPPCGEWMAEQYGPYWFDVISLALDLADMNPTQLALYLRTLTPSPLTAIEDPARHLRIERLLSAALRNVSRFRPKIMPTLTVEALRRAAGSQQGRSPSPLTDTVPAIAAAGHLPSTPGPLRRRPETAQRRSGAAG